MTIKFDYCCGCIDLRTGCLIIGYLCLIGELLTVPFCVEGLSIGDDVVTGGKAVNESDVVLAGGVIFVLFAIMLVFTLLFIIFTVYLLIGLHQNKGGNIMAFLIFTTFFLVLSFLVWIAAFWDPPVNVTFMIGDFCINLLIVYFLLVIRSYYYQIDDQMKPLGVYTA